MPTQEQLRAQRAWKMIAELKHKLPKEASDVDQFVGEARKLPFRLREAGIGPALAFLASKARERKPGLRRLLDELSAWVLDDRRIAGPNLPNGTQTQQRLLLSVINGDSTFCRRAMEETLAYLAWLNRFAEAEGLSEETSAKQ